MYHSRLETTVHFTVLVVFFAATAQPRTRQHAFSLILVPAYYFDFSESARGCTRLSLQFSSVFILSSFIPLVLTSSTYSVVQQTLPLQRSLNTQTYRPQRKKGLTDCWSTSLFRHNLYILATLSTIMNRQIYRLETQPLPPTTQELRYWHLQQLHKMRVELAFCVEFVWHCRKSNNMSQHVACTVSPSYRSVIDGFMHSTSIL